MPDQKFFNAAEIISDFINVPASLSINGLSQRFPTITDALAHLREQGMAGATLIVHSPEGERAFSETQLTAMVDALPNPMDRGN
ncbi:hypothetical protein ABIE28_002066 [Devosia sp. 2618]